jgi:dihydrofolate synthase/folylpolyglutamate synthase
MSKRSPFTKIDNLLTHLYGLRRLGIKVGLEHTNELLRRCGNPHRGLKTIHIAGTNGKGSTAAMIQAILRESGLKVGLYTSPHLIRFNERIRINGLPISDKSIIEFMAQFNSVINAVEATFFEATTVLALHYFSNQEVDVAVIETGLGGRLDSTNVIDPELTIITSIDLDHQQLLGETLIDIAVEKAGIIKKQTPVLVCSQTPEVMDVIRNKAQESNSPIIYSNNPQKIIIDHHSTCFELDKKQYSVPLIGAHQAINAGLAIRAVMHHFPEMKQTEIQSGLSNTKWFGRFQPLIKKLPIYYDVAHNPGGIHTIRATLDNLNSKVTNGIMVLKNDKHVDQIALALDGLFNELFVASIPESELMDEQSLFNALKAQNLNCNIMDSIEKGYTYLYDRALKGENGIIFGSHYVAESIYNYFEINFDNGSI